MQPQRQNLRAINPLATIFFVALLGMTIIASWWFGLSVQQLYVARLVPVVAHGTMDTIRTQNPYTSLIDFMAQLKKSGKQSTVHSVLVLAGNGYGDSDVQVLYELLPTVPRIIWPSEKKVTSTLTGLAPGDLVFSGVALKLSTKDFRQVVDGPSHVYVRTPCTYCR